MKLLSCKEFEQGTQFSELRQGSLFGALSDEGIRYLIAQGKLWSLDPSDILYEAGDPSNHFFIVLSGELQFTKVHAGLQLVTRNVEFGEEVGYVSMISLQPYGGHVEALTDSIVLDIDCNLYATFGTEYPQDFGIFTLNLARNMARNIQRLSARLVENSINH